MGNQYSPHRWVVVKITDDGESIYKVLGSWYGGFADGDSWRMNSGIVSIERDGDRLFFRGTTDSVYLCHKDSYGMSLYTSEVLQRMKEHSGVEIEVMPEDTDWDLCAPS